MDAITHAIESYTSRNAKYVSEPLSLTALRLLASNIHVAVANGQDRAARRAMSAGSNMTAIAMSYAGLGICHSLANPLTKHLGLPHGLACAMVLPQVIHFNWAANPDKFSQVAAAFGVAPDSVSIIQQLADWIGRLGLPTRLRDVG